MTRCDAATVCCPLKNKLPSILPHFMHHRLQLRPNNGHKDSANIIRKKVIQFNILCSTFCMLLALHRIAHVRHTQVEGMSAMSTALRRIELSNIVTLISVSSLLLCASSKPYTNIGFPGIDVGFIWCKLYAGIASGSWYLLHLLQHSISWSLTNIPVRNLWSMHDNNCPSIAEAVYLEEPIPGCHNSEPFQISHRLVRPAIFIGMDDAEAASTLVWSMPEALSSYNLFLIHTPNARYNGHSQKLRRCALQLERPFTMQCLENVADFVQRVLLHDCLVSVSRDYSATASAPQMYITDPTLFFIALKHILDQ